MHSYNAHPERLLKLKMRPDIGNYFRKLFLQIIHAELLPALRILR